MTQSLLAAVVTPVCPQIGYLTGLITLNLADNPNQMFAEPTAPASENPSSNAVDGKTTGAGQFAQFDTECQIVANAKGSAQHTGLSGSIPTEIGKLTALTSLSIKNTFISGTVPEQFASLSSLNYVDFSKTDMFCYKATSDNTGNCAAYNADNTVAYSPAHNAIMGTSSTAAYNLLQTIRATTGYFCNTEQDNEYQAAPGPAPAPGVGVNNKLPCGNEMPTPAPTSP